MERAVGNSDFRIHDFATWRTRARFLLHTGVAPAEAIWEDSESSEQDLFANLAVTQTEQPDAAADTQQWLISAEFLRLAETVSCHRDPMRWSLLYRVLWRLTRGGEKHLLKLSTDNDIRRLQGMAKQISRDLHKMHAFVRFQKTGDCAETGREQFVAWFEPDHFIVRFAAPFFRKRFTSMDWSILTPDECMHWRGSKLSFTDGVPREQAPSGGELDDLWRTYYRSIFNPSRLKLQAMQSEMPKKYWKNLPEAELIEELTAEANNRRDAMITRQAVEPKPRPKNAYLESLGEGAGAGVEDERSL